jgi:hypothetical protein
VEDAPVPPALAARDLHEAAWWLLEATLSGRLNPREASVAASLLRVIAGLGPPPANSAETDREVAVRALLMHGLLPRDANEWELARALFGDELLAMVRESFEERKRTYLATRAGQETG